MTFDTYQEWAYNRLNAEFDGKETQFIGLASEVGELMSERMRELRNDRESKGSQEILSEIGDILFYLSNIAKMYDFSIEEVMNFNMQKLEKRKSKKH